MGEMEKNVSKRIKKGKVQYAILSAIYTGALLGVAVLSPNALKVFANLGIVGNRKSERIYRARKRLLEKGLLATDKRGFLCITNKGQIQLAVYGAVSLKKKKWDKKWRVLIFDISEKRRKTRDQTRNKLMAVGFIRLQDSVWVYPYNCEDFVSLLKAEMKLGKNLLYLIVDSIENEKQLKKEFGLSL